MTLLFYLDSYYKPKTKTISARNTNIVMNVCGLADKR